MWGIYQIPLYQGLGKSTDPPILVAYIVSRDRIEGVWENRWEAMRQNKIYYYAI